MTTQAPTARALAASAQRPAQVVRDPVDVLVGGAGSLVVGWGRPPGHPDADASPVAQPHS